MGLVVLAILEAAGVAAARGAEGHQTVGVVPVGKAGLGRVLSVDGTPAKLDELILRAMFVGAVVVLLTEVTQPTAHGIEGTRVPDNGKGRLGKVLHTIGKVAAPVGRILRVAAEAGAIIETPLPAGSGRKTYASSVSRKQVDNVTG